MINSEFNRNLNSIRRISRIVQAVALMAMGLFTVMMLAGDVSVDVSNNVPIEFKMELPARLLDHIAQLPYRLSALAALYFLFRLFGLFAKGDIFTQETVKNFRRLSLAVIAVGLNKIGTGVYVFLFSTFLSNSTSSDLYVDVTGGSLVALIMGLMLYAFALVQQEAKTQTEDLRLIF